MTNSISRGVVALGLVGLVTVACQRAPEEPPPSPSQARSASATSDSKPHPADPSRCIVPTPAQAPASVPPGPAKGCPPDSEPNMAPLPRATLVFPDAPSTPRVDAEIARSLGEQARGLMFRTSLPEDAAMIFPMMTKRVQEFWMRNTCIPLDMMFLDDDGLIVGIAENVPTLNDNVRGVDCPSHYVLEVNAGWCRRHGVKAGQRVAIPDNAHF